MLEFHHYIELIAFAVGIACFKNAWPFHFKLLLFLAGFTCLIELTGMIMWKVYHLENNWIYNIFSPIESLIVLYFFYAIIEKKRLKLIVLYSFFAAIAATFITYYWHENFVLYNNYAAAFYYVLWIIGCCCFFVDAMSNENTERLFQQSGFWFSLGLLFFACSYILMISLYKIFVTLPSYKKIILIINMFSNGFMYGGFIGAFICQRINKK